MSKNLANFVYLYFSSAYGERFFRQFTSDEQQTMWFEIWSDQLTGLNVDVVKSVVKDLVKKSEFIPTVAEIIHEHDRLLAIPSVNEALRLAINRDFSCPLVQEAFDKIGSWAMRNDSEKELMRKFKPAYEEALNNFRRKRNYTQPQLESVESAQGLVHDKRIEDTRDQPRRNNLHQIEKYLP